MLPTGASYWVSEHPTVFGVLAAMTLLTVAYAAWHMQRRVSAWRARSRA